MRTFVLNRKEDVSGISGTGIIAEGTIFSTGKIALLWLGTNSFGLWDDMESLIRTHGHQGKTVVEYTD